MAAPVLRAGLHPERELGRGSAVFLVMTRAFVLVWLMAWPVVAAAQTVDYTRTLEQARQFAREDVPLGQAPDATATVPRASVLDGAHAQPLVLKPVLPNPGDRLGVRVDTETVTGVRPYLGADVAAGLPVDGLPAPTLELGAAVSTDRDTHVSAGIRQPPPVAGAPAATPPAFRFGLERRF